MPGHVASLLCYLGIATLFALDRDRKNRCSVAVWIPIVWFFLGASRPVSGWLEAAGLAGTGWSSSPDQYTEGSPIDRFAFSGLLLIGLAVLIPRRQSVIAVLRSNFTLISFFVYAAVS